MRIEFVKSAQLPERARQLMNAGFGFFGQTAWFELLIRHVFTAVDAMAGYLMAVGENESIALVCPAFYRVSRWGLRSFQSLTCFYTPLFNWATEDKSTLNASLRDFFRLLEQGPLPWHQFTIQALPEENAQAMVAELMHAGMAAVTFYAFANWYLPVTHANFDEYLASRPSHVRNTVRRKSKAFMALPQTRIELYTDEACLERASKDYSEVYGDSWKQDEAFPGFIDALIRLTARQGSLRLGIAHLGSEPIAAQFWIVADNTAYIYKLAYKQAYKSLGAGTVLTAALMRHVMEIDRVMTVDYLTGDDAYKRDWMTLRRERWGVVVFNTSTLLGVGLYWLELAKRKLKAVAKLIYMPS